MNETRACQTELCTDRQVHDPAEDRNPHTIGSRVEHHRDEGLSTLGVIVVAVVVVDAITLRSKIQFRRQERGYTKRRGVQYFLRLALCRREEGWLQVRRSGEGQLVGVLGERP